MFSQGWPLCFYILILFKCAYFSLNFRLTPLNIFIINMLLQKPFKFSELLKKITISSVKRQFNHVQLTVLWTHDNLATDYPVCPRKFFLLLYIIIYFYKCRHMWTDLSPFSHLKELVQGLEGKRPDGSTVLMETRVEVCPRWVGP
jgi:hypothetical protein